jgi:glucan 1,3-beta-glucosidase
MIIGEFSASLDPHSFPPNCDDTEKDRHRRVFLRAQLDLYEEFCAGWFFWTLKKGNGWDAGWSAKDSMTAEILPRWVGGKVKRQDLGGVSQEQRLKGLLGQFYRRCPMALSS